MPLGNAIARWLRGGRENPKPLKLADYRGQKVPLNPAIYGEELHTDSIPASFIFEGGGMGDYVCWTSAIKYFADTYTHVDARIFTSELFLDVIKYVFKDKTNWTVAHRNDFEHLHVHGSTVAQPRRGTQLLNACGAHLMDLGANYFLCLDYLPPEYNHFVEIDYQGEWKWPELNPKMPYAIFTPGSTTDVREMPVPAFDELVRYTIHKGITPVFLGKCELSENYNAKFLGYNFNKGVDLRERTTLLEATQIIRGAKFIVGIDNGLLHMAGTTDTPIIFGHNITAVRHRDIRRRNGLTINVTAAEKTLACIGCQSKVRFIPGHDFRRCLFRENPDLNKKCLHVLFKDNAPVWKQAIDQAIEDGDKYRSGGGAKNVTLLV